MSRSPVEPADAHDGVDPLFSGGGVMGEVMTACDWAATPVGQPATWDPVLRSVVRILLTSRFSMWMGWGPELTFFYNDAYQRDTLQAKHPWALGRPAREVWAEIWDDIDPRIESVRSTGVATWDENLLLFLERSGYREETYHTFSYSPLGDTAGDVPGVLCVVTENTDQVLSERRTGTLRDVSAAVSAARTEREVVDAAAAALAGNPHDVPFALLFLVDDDGTVRPAGGVGIDIGGPAGDPAAWPIERLLAGETVVVDDLATRLGPLPRGAWGRAPDQAVAVPFGVVGDSHVPGFLVVGLNPFRSFDDAHRGFVELTAGQIAAAVAGAGAYETQRRRAEELTELDRVKTAFFANISHEFRTPLTLMLGPVAQLRAAPAVASDPRLAEELAVVHRNGLRLGKLVNSLLDFSRLEAGKARPSAEPLDLAAVTAELATLFRPATERAGLDLTITCPPLPHPVPVDRDMWETVVLNLLSNAVKFTFSGGITVALAPAGDEVVLQVSDTGIGIPAGEIDRLFQRFHQVPGARGRSAEGSGIGLALARELVELHSGTLSVASVENSGTTFTVRLPAGAAHQGGTATTRVSAAAVEPYVSEALRWMPGRPVAVPDATAGALPEPTVTHGTVLVVDDNADMREYLHRLLADRYDVVAVADGRAALEAVRGAVPDLVVSDVMMPGIGGMELLARLRAEPSTSTVPVMLLSARAGQEAAIEGLALGADDYLVKPFSAAELLARVDSRIALSRVRRAAERRFRGLADATPTMIWVDGPGEQRVLVTRAWRDFVGAPDVAGESSLDADLGSTWRTRIHPDDVERYSAARRAAEATRSAFELEYRLRRDDGRYCWVLDRGAPFVLDGAEEGAVGYVGGCLDIDDRYRERERERLLSVIGAAMDRVTTVAERRAVLVRTLVAEGVGDMARLIAVGEREDDATVVAVAARTREQEQLLWHIAAWSPAAREVCDTGEVRLATADEAYTVVGSPEPEQRAMRHTLDTSSVLLVPLTTRARVAGLLVVGRATSSPELDAVDTALLTEIGERAATALDNAALLERERETGKRLALLQQATGALSAAATPAEVAAVAAVQFGALLGTDVVGLWEVREETLVALELSRFGAAARAEWTTLSLGADVPLAAAVRARAGVWVAGPEEWDERYPHLANVVAGYGHPTIGCLPLQVGNRCVGAVAFAYDAVHVPDTEQLTAAAALADQCAQALQRADLLAVESTARRTAEGLGAVVAALSGATTLTQVASVIMDQSRILGAAATVIVLQEGEHLEVLDSSRGGPGGLRRIPVDAPHPLAEAVRTGAPVWNGAGGAGLPGQLTVPLLLGGVAIGAVGMTFDGPVPPLSAAQRATLSTVAGQYAQALDRARLYQVEHEVADVLQRSLLPGELPDLARIDATARYLPGTLDTQAGGDWYDLLVIDDDRVALVVGDVVGHGPPAAAVMGKLSSAVSSYLLDGHSPAAALERLDRFARRIPAAIGSTCVCLTLDWRAGELVWASAGHLPLLLVEAGGARFLDGGNGTVLGVRGRPPYQEERSSITAGSSVVAYTDGLVERRGEVVDDGLETLASIASAVRERPTEEIADDLLTGLLAGAPPVDDVAMVVVRLIPEPLSGSLPADPRSLSVLRRRVAAWAGGAGLPDVQRDDLQLAVGEAAANATEHAYDTDGVEGTFEFRLERTAAGDIAASVRDHGTWRPQPVDPGFRGRGLQIIRTLGDDVALTVDPDGDGTEVAFLLRRPGRDKPIQGDTGPDDVPYTVTVPTDLDIAGVETVRPAVMAALAGHRDVTIDLRRVRYLGSAGVGLLTDAHRHATDIGARLTVRVAAGSHAARVLELTRHGSVLPVVTD